MVIASWVALFAGVGALGTLAGLAVRRLILARRRWRRMLRSTLDRAVAPPPVSCSSALMDNRLTGPMAIVAGGVAGLLLDGPAASGVRGRARATRPSRPRGPRSSRVAGGARWAAPSPSAAWPASG